MNGRLADLADLQTVADHAAGVGPSVTVLICPPAVLVAPFARELGTESALGLGGQDCHTAEKGAHTGDVSAEQLKDSGAGYVIVGHSERRADHGEGDAVVKAKALAANRAGLVPIICVGESEGQRDQGVADAVVGDQLRGSVPDTLPGDAFMVAYEPVWAIGTGRTPEDHEIAAMHDHIRSVLEDIGVSAPDAVSLLYGGSVKPGNAVAILALSNVDGALVGGASLKSSDFIPIIEAAR